MSGKFYYLCESFVAVGQVRSSVNSKNDIITALENVESVKNLDRSAGGNAVENRTKEPINNHLNYLDQIYSFLFITGKTIAEESISDTVMQFILERHSHLWPNVIFAFNNYLITYACDGGICPNPMHARGLALQSATNDSELLLRFYVLLGRAIEVMSVGSMPYWEYMQAAHQWSANVILSTVSNPPPYLSLLVISRQG